MNNNLNFLLQNSNANSNVREYGAMQNMWIRMREFARGFYDGFSGKNPDPTI